MGGKRASPRFGPVLYLPAKGPRLSTATEAAAPRRPLGVCVPKKQGLPARSHNRNSRLARCCAVVVFVSGNVMLPRDTETYGVNVLYSVASATSSHSVNGRGWDEPPLRETCSRLFLVYWNEKNVSGSMEAPRRQDPPTAARLLAALFPRNAQRSVFDRSSVFLCTIRRTCQPHTSDAAVVMRCLGQFLRKRFPRAALLDGVLVYHFANVSAQRTPVRFGFLDPLAYCSALVHGNTGTVTLFSGVLEPAYEETAADDRFPSIALQPTRRWRPPLFARQADSYTSCPVYRFCRCVVGLSRPSRLVSSKAAKQVDHTSSKTNAHHAPSKGTLAGATRSAPTGRAAPGGRSCAGQRRCRSTATGQ